MADEHFSHEVIERFFRSELSRGENREFVRHLLRQCPQCSRLLREVAQGLKLRLLVNDVEPSRSRFASGSAQQVLDHVLRLVGRSGNRLGRGRRPAGASLR